MIIYPDKPWTDGQEFSFILSNGTYVVGTYNAAKNAWSLQRVLPETLNVRPPIFSDNPPTVYPDPNLPDNKLVPGDIWYDTSDDAGAIKHVWDGTQWLAEAENNNLQTTLTLPTVNENGGLRAFAQSKLNEKSINFDVPVIANQFDANHALVEMIAAVAVEQPEGPGDDFNFDLYATRAWVSDNYATVGHGHNNYALENHQHSQYATTSYVDSVVGNIIIEPPNLDGYATETWVSQNYAVSNHNHSQYVTTNTLNTRLGDYATSQELEVASNHIDLKSTDGVPFSNLQQVLMLLDQM